MKLKFKITKDDYEKLSDELKKLYSASGDDYTLQVDGVKTDDDIAALKRAKDREAQQRKDLQKELDDLKAEQEKDKDDKARNAGDIDTLTRSYEEKLSKQKKEFEDKITNKDNFIRSTLVDNVASKLATEVSTSPSALIPYIKTRLSADLDGDVPTTKVLDAAGNLSASTIDDLKKEILANKEFSAILIANKASGSGANSKVNGQKGQSSAYLNADGKPKSMREMTPAERVEYLTAKKEEKENGS